MTVVPDELGAETTRPAAQPGRLIVSVYGLYARERGGWLSVASLVRLLADLEIDGQAVRSAVSRLKRRGLLDAESVGKTAGYRLTPAAHDILVEGDARIFDRRRAGPDEGWLLVVFSVPEIERDKRHLIRTQLTRLGLGAVTPGVWIAPAHLETAVAHALERSGLRGYTDLFRSQHVAGSDTQAIDRWWDLDALQQQYAQFLTMAEPVLERWRPGEVDPALAFADFVRIVTVWRRLPYLDPGLPVEALPADWAGLAAEELFSGLRARLAGPAREHAMSVLDGPT